MPYAAGSIEPGTGLFLGVNTTLFAQTPAQFSEIRERILHTPLSVYCWARTYNEAHLAVLAIHISGGGPSSNP